MAFIRKWRSDQDEIFIENLRNDDEALVFVELGHDPEINTTFMLFMALNEYPGGNRELAFSFVVVNDEGQFPIHNGLETKKYVQRRDDREHILNIVCCAATHIVDRQQPSTITVSTIDTYLPRKALTKYNVICDAIRRLGYEGGRVSAFHGQEQWLLRLEPSA